MLSTNKIAFGRNFMAINNALPTFGRIRSQSYILKTYCHETTYPISGDSDIVCLLFLYQKQGMRLCRFQYRVCKDPNRDGIGEYGSKLGPLLYLQSFERH